MKNKLYILMSILFFGCSSIKTIPVSNSISSTEGFYYALPKTYLNVEFELQKKVTKKGVYFEYAECIGLNAEIIASINKNIGTKYSIKSTSLTNNAYLDKGQIYQMNLNQKFLNKTNFSVEYAQNGELTNANFESENQLIPTIITVANVVSDIAGSATFLSENILDNNGDAITICDSLPSYVKNDLAELNKINGSLHNLLRMGPEGLSQEQLEYRIKEFKSLKAGIISKFMATTSTKNIKFSFEVDPETIKDGNPIDLFKYDKLKGFERHYNTNPHNPGVKLTNNMPFTSKTTLDNKAEVIQLKLIHLDNNMASFVSQKKGSQNEGSFYYRIPGYAHFVVTKSKNNLTEKTLPIPQFGTTVAAPTKLRKITFKLHPGLGSIYTVSGKSDSLSFGDLDSLRKSLIKDKNVKRIEELENKIKIKELEHQLNNVGVEEEVIEEEVETTENN